MESLVEQPYAQQEKEKQTFDILASVNMARYDLDNFGAILPETSQQIYNEELSYIVEGMEEEACTDFDLIRDSHGNLTYFYQGRWRPYLEMLDEAIEVSKSEAQADSRKRFMLERAYIDHKYGEAMQSLSPGQELRWHSSYCFEEAERFGTDFVDDLGFISERQMGFLYRAVCLADGSVRLFSQTVDKSDQDAFQAAQSADKDTRPVDAYDAVLETKYGKKFRGGQEVLDPDCRHEDAWQKLQKETDLVEHYMNKITWLARKSIEMTELELHNEKKLLTFGVWAALKKRFDGEAPLFTGQAEALAGYSVASETIRQNLLDHEIMAARQEFASIGRILTGCGGSIAVESESDLLLADVKSVRDGIFSSMDDGDCEFISKKCPECSKVNVRTIVRKIPGTQKKHISGSCGCSVTR